MGTVGGRLAEGGYCQGRFGGPSRLAAGLAFGVLGAGTVVGGSAAPGEGRGSPALLPAATFTGGVGDMLVIVGFMVTATSGLADHE